jgi:hypothetical protein
MKCEAVCGKLATQFRTRDVATLNVNYGARRITSCCDPSADEFVRSPAFFAGQCSLEILTSMEQRCQYRCIAAGHEVGCITHL